MNLLPTPLDGLLLVQTERHEDARGGFARLWCGDEFAAAGVRFQPRQASLSCNRVAFTLRGLHWQAAPHAETKLVRALRGRVFDVAVDLRPHSSTYQRWHARELDAISHEALLIPAGFAHGYITLTRDAELLYLIDTPYIAEAARGARYDDPRLGIAWPRPPVVIAERDLTWPAL
jgi:dTDP-4-dehydrorhamnose 3,5-epimerase